MGKFYIKALLCSKQNWSFEAIKLHYAGSSARDLGLPILEINLGSLQRM